ncbi:hypothetical protein SH501x_000937 [Pirellulaceae bacterium SH501]
MQFHTSIAQVAFVALQLAAFGQLLTIACASESEQLNGKAMQKVAELPAYSIQAVVEKGDVQLEVAISLRASKWLIKSKQTKFENTPESKFVQELIAQRGVDITTTIIFDGTNLISHYPVKYLVTIDEAPKPTVDEKYQVLFPKSWNSFYIKSNSEKLNLSYLIDLESPQKATAPSPHSSLLRITEASLSEKPVGFKTRYIDVDESTGLVSKSHMGGGSALPVTKEYSWASQDGRWYPKSGKVTIAALEPITWTINSFSHDAKDIKHKFSLDDLSLPIGTRIAEDSLGKKGQTKNRFVGGEEGKREHSLKLEEARILREKGSKQ